MHNQLRTLPHFAAFMLRDFARQELDHIADVGKMVDNSEQAKTHTSDGCDLSIYDVHVPCTRTKTEQSEDEGAD